MGFTYTYQSKTVGGPSPAESKKRSPRPVNVPGAKGRPRVLPDHTVCVTLTIPRHVADRIDALLAAPGRSAGFKSGRAHWVRKLIYKALDLAESPDSGDRVADLHEAYLKTADISLLQSLPDREQPILKRILELRGMGLTYPEVAEALTEENFSTVSGKKWLPGTVYYYLQKLVPPGGPKIYP